MSDNPGYSYQSVPNSTSALISLIFGILGLTLLPIIGCVVALIFGYIARRENRESSGTLGGEGLATTGIILGWVGVGLTVIGCCIFGSFFLLPACLIPLGINWSQYGLLTPLLVTI